MAGIGFVAGLVFGLLAPGSARAHFLWLTAERAEPPEVHAFLSETPTPDLPELLKVIARAEITAGGRRLSWTRADDTYKVELPRSSPGVKVVDGFCDLGVLKRGGSTFRLLYTARVQFGPSAATEAEAADHLRLRLIAQPGRPPAVVVRFRGKPVAGAVIKAFPDEGEAVELKSGPEGRVEAPGVAEGRTGLLARWVEAAPGEHNGKPYVEVRHYATLTVAPPAAGAPASKPAEGDSNPGPNAPFAWLPEAVNSFGGAVSDGWLYVYSGHTGDTHQYNAETTTAHFRRLDLRDRTTWEELPCGPALQGATLVAHGGMLYRIGGSAAKNRPGKLADLASVAGFARFDPKARTWTELPKLPSPRSTHDAVVAGDRIYVIGGWSLNGGAATNSEFCDDALVFDLARKDARWEKLPDPPFRRRALAAAENGGKIYVLGGLTEDGAVVKSVDIYDPATKSWSQGPEMPGSKLQGFAPSAFGIGGRLYVSGRDGALLRLSADGKAWEVAGKLAIPRLTHRLLPGIANDVLAVGGSFAGSPVGAIESLLLTDAPAP
jgi:hypothetical protein